MAACLAFTRLSRQRAHDLNGDHAVVAQLSLAGEEDRQAKRRRQFGEPVIAPAEDVALTLPQRLYLLDRKLPDTLPQIQRETRRGGVLVQQQLGKSGGTPLDQRSHADR